MKYAFLIAAAVSFVSASAMADHANPWATEDDTVLSQYHDENQSRSADTPGEDEMRGAMVRNARGKLDEGAGSGQAGKGRGGKSSGKR
ncbi:hypothetical protein [Marivita geojedonensis]|uniref:Lipoprotein n=1 Tax=Marivita geojedonensis TaxID=1123756 RepID=A0A1X4NLR2_9RHOB|nr:hypothetical protein [Marivita geojedonensis]OSQ51225.1 hypothetical protein MGEO_09165 [Marivita geojedonensis]PRY78513.1 hypothetical protein CLV76_10672 [Marivita geojedonensis]